MFPCADLEAVCRGWRINIPHLRRRQRRNWLQMLCIPIHTRLDTELGRAIGCAVCLTHIAKGDNEKKILRAVATRPDCFVQKHERVQHVQLVLDTTGTRVTACLGRCTVSQTEVLGSFFANTHLQYLSKLTSSFTQRVPFKGKKFNFTATASVIAHVESNGPCVPVLGCQDASSQETHGGRTVGEECGRIHRKELYAKDKTHRNRDPQPARNLSL